MQHDTPVSVIKTAWLATAALILAATATAQDESRAADVATVEDVAESIPDPLTLAWCVERAQARNPSIEIEKAGLDAARHRITPAGALDDPRLSYEASNVPIGDLDFDSTPMSGHQFGLRQKFPFPGLLSSRRDAAEARARAAAHAVADRVLTIDSAVESSWAELGFSQRAFDITERNLSLLRQLVRIAEARYRVGSGLQQDVLRAQVELTVLLEEKLEREAAIERAEAGLGELLDLTATTVFPRTASLEDASALPVLKELTAALEQRNAQLLALDAQVEAAKWRVRVAELEGYPDFDLGIGYRLRQKATGDPVGGDDFIGAGFTVRLPVNRSKWNAHVAERRALLRKAKGTYRQVRASLLAGLRTSHSELRRAESEEILLRTGLVPQARQSLESSRSGYEVGRIDFLSVLDSQVRLLNAELQLVRAHADKRRAFASLEAVAGGPLR
ncbi:MAG: TolC family protein [Myxococcales bacterium]|nr:TolC family protein [Myxococcales bacterium]